MSEFFFSYGLFFAKIITSLIALLIAVAIIGMGASRKKQAESELVITYLNDKYKDFKDKLIGATMDRKEHKKQLKAQKKLDKQQSKQKGKQKGKQKHDELKASKPKLYVLDFEGDIKASAVDSLRDEITALLSVATTQDEILLRLDNSGGAVHEHGLASSQLERIKSAKLNLTVSVDRVAASGGYMMACVADKIVAAPFAILGSIGVLAQLPNFHRLLDKHGVDFEQHTAGEFKRTVTMFGENGEKEREKLKLDLQDIHTLFRDFVSKHRSKLDIDAVATGEYWYGIRALELNLVDELKTSDDYLLSAADHYDIYQVNMEQKQKITDKLFGGLFAGINKASNKLAEQQNNSRFL